MLPNANETIMWFGHSFLLQTFLCVYAAAVANDAIVSVEHLCVNESANDDCCLVLEDCDAANHRQKRDRKTKKNALAWEELVVGRKTERAVSDVKFGRFHLSNGAVIYIIKNSAHFQDPASGGVANLKHFLEAGERVGVTFDTVYYTEPHARCFFEKKKGRVHCIDIERIRDVSDPPLSFKNSAFLPAFLESSARQVVEILPWSGDGQYHYHHHAKELVFDSGTYLEEHSHGMGSCTRVDGKLDCTGGAKAHGHLCLPGVLTSLAQSILAWSERLRQL
jgi:hypothetical protein